MKIQSVVVIYNPNSTGPSRKNAEQFVAKLRYAGVTARSTIPTKRRGHAKTLARQYAERPTPTMIISSSGDGSYNEVINGILRSKNPEAVAGVLPSGNANDHWNFLHHGNTVQRIKHGDVEQIDVLKISCGSWHRYAHSYIGLGMTPQIGEVLTKNKLNPLKEFWLVLTHFFKVRPVKIAVDGDTRRFDHLVFSNIGRMSKYLKVADHGTIHDGEFAVIEVKSGTIGGLTSYIFRAASTGVRADTTTNRYVFTCLRPLKIQLDGEVVEFDEGDEITITSEQQLLSTIV